MSRTHLVFFLSFIAFSVIASFFFPRSLWGVSAWGALSPIVGLVCALVIAPQLFFKAPVDPFVRIPRIRSGAVRYLVTVLCAIALLSLLRSRHALWGERLALREAIEQGVSWPTAPLAIILQRAVYRFMNVIFLWGADPVITLFAVASGALYTLGAFRAAELLAGRDGEGAARRLAAAALLSSGFAPLFFGHGGNIPLAVVAALAFIIAGIRFLRVTGSLVPAALILAAAILLHVSSCYLVPAFLYLCTLGMKDRARRADSSIALISLLVTWAIAEIILARLAGQADKAAGLAGAARSMTGAWRAAGAAVIPNALNAFLILGPASVLAMLLLAARGQRQPQPPGTAREESRFLALGAVAALALIIAAAGLIDGGLSWHAVAPAGPALSLCALGKLRMRYPGKEHFAKSLSILFLVGAFHAFPLVLVDAIPRAAERRLLALPLAPGRAEAIIADGALERGDREGARSWYLASLEKNKANALVDFRLGRIAMAREEHAEAITHFLNAHELAPELPRYRFELAEALIAKLWYPEAIAQLETLTVAHPDSVLFWRRLGYARNNGNRYAAAVAAYERALALEPGNEENVRNLVSALLNRGAELQREKRYDDARSLYERAIALYPNDWHAYNNLAVIEMNLERYQNAYDILANALTLHAYESSLNFNMGIVLEKLGRNREALDRMRMARDLNPIYSEAPIHIERLERRLGIPRGEIQADSQRSPLKMP